MKIDVLYFDMYNINDFYFKKLNNNITKIKIKNGKKIYYNRYIKDLNYCFEISIIKK